MSEARKIYQMKIAKIVDHTKDVRELIIETQGSDEFKFKAGQFVMLHVPQSEKPALRAYSIASSEKVINGFKLLFKFVPNGVASNYVWSLKGDEILNFTGPFGRVFFKEPPTEQIIFLNTGTGLSQHFSYLISKKDQYPNLKYRLLFGVRSESDIYYRNELEELKNQLINFDFEYILSKADQNWQGKRGYVQQYISEFDYMNIPTSFYLCGNGGMIKETKAILETAGFDKTKIFSEAFD